MVDWTAFVRSHLRLTGLQETREAEIVEEVARQLEDAYREAMTAGATEPDARAIAERHITDWQGLAEQLSRSSRQRQPAFERWSAHVDDTASTRGGFTGAGRLFADLRSGIRLMLRTPGFSALAVLMLALGTGANTAVFSVVDAVMLRSPFEQPHEMALVLALREDGRQTSGVPRAAFERLAGLPHVIASAAAYTIGSPVVTNVDVPRRTQVECVPAAMVDVLRSRPLLGRWFSAAEDTPTGPPVGVVSHAFWREVLNGDPDVLGRHLLLDGDPLTVVGVMPHGFDGVRSLPNRDIWVPYGQVTSARPRYGCRPPDQSDRAIVNALVRVRSGLSVGKAASMVHDALGPQPAASGGVVRLTLLSATEARVADLRGMFTALTGAALAILLIACVNVGNLGLARLVGRRREMAVRLALGATRARIVRQSVIEQLVVAGIAALLGVGIAVVTRDAVVSLVPRNMPQASFIALNTRVLTASIGVTMLAACLVGLIPALQASSTRLRAGLAHDDRGTTAGGRRVRSTLVVVELALGLVLLIGALLMIRTFLILRPSAPGFDPSRKVIALARLPPRMSVQDKRQFVDEVSRRLRRSPGVSAVAGSTYFPMSRSVSILPMTVAGVTAEVNTVTASANYLDLLRIPVVRGRGFLESDGVGAPPIALVNEAFVRRWLADREPLDTLVTIQMPGSPAPVERRIVGIFGDTRSWGADTRSRPELIVPFGQEIEGSPYFVISGTAAALATMPSTLRQIVSSVRPGQLVDRIDRLETLLAAEVAYPRLGAWVLGLFGGLAVALAALGLACTLAWSVAERRREIGVRMALGASPSAVAALIVRHTLLLTTIAVVVGVTSAVFASRLLQRWIYGITTTDVGTYVGCAVAMLAVALAASYVPARRAARVDPLVTLKAD